LQPPPDGGKPFRPESVEFPIFKSQKLYKQHHRMKKLDSRLHSSLGDLPPVEYEQLQATMSAAHARCVPAT